MLPNTPPATKRRLLIGLTILAVLLVGFTAVGIYGLIAGPPTTPTISDTTRSGASETTPKPNRVPLTPLPETPDGERFARAVAETLFAWDTYSMNGLPAHRQLLLDVADPSGIETPGLIADLDRYFPTAEQWRSLSEYQTAQHLEIDRVEIPAQWADAVAASDGRLTKGHIAYTVTGTRTRTGVWLGDPVSMQEPVEFTMFLSCPPATEQCRLLRLSQLGNALH